jgi:hypothetical protein
MSAAIDRSPLPTGMRDRLLAILELGYPANAPQARLGNAPDAAIAWQVQSMLDEYADPDGFANDNSEHSPDPDNLRALHCDDRWTGDAA